MTTNKIKFYEMDKQPIATYAMSAFQALGVFEQDYDVEDRVKVAWINDENKRTAYRWVKVRYDNEGDAYIFVSGERRYFQYFM